MRTRVRGLSLFELIIVIVVLSVGAVTLSSAYFLAAKSVGSNQDVLLTYQYAQECADHIFGKGRDPGAFSALLLSTAECNALPALPSGITRTLTCSVSAAITGTSCAALSVGASLPCVNAAWRCVQYQIDVTRNAYTATVYIMLVES